MTWMDAADPPLVQLLRGLEERSLERLGLLLSIQEHPDGDVLFRQGEPGDALFLILDGEALVERLTGPDGERSSLVAVLGSGDVVGEMSLVDGQPRSATVRARGRLRVLRLTRDGFRELARDSPDAALHVVTTLLAVLSVRVREGNAALELLQESGRLLGVARSLAEVGDALLHQAMRAIPSADAGIVTSFEGDACAPIVAAGLGIPRAAIPLDRRSVLVEAMIARRDGLIVGPGDDTAAPLAFMQRRWFLAAPIGVGREVEGVVLLASNSVARPFSPVHQVVLGALAQQAGSAFALRRASR